MKRIAATTAVLLITLLFGSFDAEAQLFGRKKRLQKKEETQPIPEKTDYERFVDDTKGLETFDGFIKMHKTKDRLYFELPDSLLGRDMLISSTVTEISDNSLSVIGSKPNKPIHIKFTKIKDNIFLRVVEERVITPDYDETLGRAVEMSNIPPVMEMFDIRTYNNDSTAYVFDVTKLFVGNVKEFSPFRSGSSQSDVREVYRPDASFLGDVKGFEDNLSVCSTLSYNLSFTKQRVDNVPFTAVVTRTVLLLDETPYRPRRTDNRVAIFPTPKMLYDSEKQEAKRIFYANRWRLEPSDREAFDRGEVVEPIEPIVFYIDPNFPKTWRDHVVAGVNRWQEAFEEIGFKNAVQARDYPSTEEVLDFDPDNLKYSCVRYAPVQIANAMGPSWVDPRSGEILNASVYVYHDVIKLLNNWIFVQTSAADKRVRSVNIPDEVMGDGLRFVIAHEIGHCLGFMHNMGASATVPVDSLRSPTYTQQHGTSPSIMDYARFNYVAQPGDVEKGVKTTPAHYGDYDRFMVKWSYAPLPEDKSVDEIYEITSGWVRERSADSTYRFGQQQIFGMVDPRSQSEDLGDDAMKASAYGIKNLKYTINNCNDWVAEEDRDYSFRTSIYGAIVQQYMRYFGHVYANVGGIYLYEKHVGDHVERYASVPSEKQREALLFLLEMISDVEWLDNKELMRNMRVIGSPAEIVREALMNRIMTLPERVEFSASKATDRPYTVEDCLTDIYNYIWKPTLTGKALTEPERRMQVLFVESVGRQAGIEIKEEKGFMMLSNSASTLLDETPAYSCNVPHNHLYGEGDEGVMGYFPMGIPYEYSKDLSPVYYGYLIKARDVLRNNRYHHDKDSRLHYQLLLHNIEKALNK